MFGDRPARGVGERGHAEVADLPPRQMSGPLDQILGLFIQPEAEAAKTPAVENFMKSRRDFSVLNSSMAGDPQAFGGKFVTRSVSGSKQIRCY